MTDRQEERLVELLEQTGMLDSKSRCRIAAEELLANGVRVPPCKVGDKVYMRFEGEITPLTIIRISTLETIDGISRCYDAKNKIVSTSFTDRHINKTMFLTKEEAEEKLKEREGK